MGPKKRRLGEYNENAPSSTATLSEPSHSRCGPSPPGVSQEYEHRYQQEGISHCEVGINSTSDPVTLNNNPPQPRHIGSGGEGSEY
ncbi:predicted protein [Chaetomium globosum CBS 148.51]|uniref:Uncharacterized protein n=1 Tax=Chaetomium globosum (strain ATCC 6205 / CBS 148.51 / DSM 1962 / NBRC 6347 / NRRL 1970) TaxID=306901 RepID=Q2H4C8_CHAGB|nr:uncharacterized protein CHGG_06487 [Chaetomium globosum CBS 148.51]EAQ89868.1 predicted protein [Chaetomium globosum CBS 148.51]